MLAPLARLQKVTFAGRGVGDAFRKRLAAQVGRDVYSGVMHTARRSTAGKAPWKQRR